VALNSTHQDAYQECARILRDHDRDRYLAGLFAPSDVRANLHALYAFDIEVGRVPSIVSEAMVGEIRLQWWRDALSGVAHGELSGAPVLVALQDTLSGFGLAPDRLITLTEARIFDLYDDRMPDMVALEGYAGETDAAILQFAATILSRSPVPEAADVSGHGGVASVILRGLMRFAQSGLRDARLVPTALGEEHGLVLDTAAAKPVENAGPVWAALCKEALMHIAKAQQALSRCPEVVDPAYFHLALVARDLQRLSRAGPSPATASPGSAFARQWHLWRAARNGGLRGVRI
jgi:phytoene synthase